MGKNFSSSRGQKRMNQLGKPTDKANNVWGTVRHLISYWREFKWILVLVTAFSLIEVGCTLLAPYLIGKTIDDCIVAAIKSDQAIDFSKLMQMLLLLGGIYVFNSFCSWVQQYNMLNASQRITKKMREEMDSKLHSLSIRFYDTHQRGEIMTHFTNDVELIKDALGDTMIQLTSSAFTIIGTMTFMFALSYQLMLVACITIPLVILLSRFVMMRTRRYFSQQQIALGKLNGLIEEDVAGMKIIRNFTQEENQIKKFEEYNNNLKQAGMKAQIYSGILMPLMRVLDNLSYIIVAVTGGLLAFNGIISIGIIQSFLLYTKNFLRPINQVATQFNSVQSAIAGAERIFGFLDEKSEVCDKENAIELKNVKGEVVFDHVTFGYEPGKIILNDLSFKAEPDEVIAIVGSTGAGKTTIINLLTRFYDVNSGSIKIDGVDIRDVTQSSLRHALGIVLQEPFLFSETIRYNIAYGRPGAVKEDIKAASIAANARNFIRKLTHRFRTLLREGGEDISHGQRQLITIARAVIANTPILVLDEATSNIDSRTEILIQKAIANLTKGKTCFIIAHRLSTIRNADKILVIENGKIVESGKHEELIEKQGAYYRIYSSQFTQVSYKNGLKLFRFQTIFVFPRKINLKSLQ